jgi:hypothetical protein
MRQAHKLSGRELDLCGLHEVERPALGGRIGSGADGEPCEAADPPASGAPDRMALLLAYLLDEGYRPAWQLRAACRGAGTAQFFPMAGKAPDLTTGVCGACAVAWECLSYGLDTGSVGIWGGLVLSARTR